MIGSTSPSPGPRHRFKKDTYPMLRPFLKLSADSLGGRLKAGLRSPILLSGLAAVFLVLAFELSQKEAKLRVLLLLLLWGQKVAATELDQLYAGALTEAFEETSGAKLNIWSQACSRDIFQTERAKAQSLIVSGGILGPERHSRLVLVAQSQKAPRRANSLSMPITNHSLGEVFKQASRRLFEQSKGFLALSVKQTAKERCQQQKLSKESCFGEFSVTTAKIVPSLDRCVKKYC